MTINILFRNYLVILLADGLIFVSEIGPSENFTANKALHTFWMIKFSIGLHRIAFDVHFADETFFLDFLFGREKN